MTSIVKKAIAGLAATAALVGTVSAPAEARPYYGGYGYHHYRGGIGPGRDRRAQARDDAAAIASPHYNDGYGYGYGYAPPPRAYYGGYGRGYYPPCRVRGVWDPYIREYVQMSTCY